MLVSLQYFHHLSHYDIFYPISCSHLYHHNHNNFFSHFIQVIIEYVMILSPLIFKYILQYFFNYEIPIFNTYHIIFIYFFYTTVHNINYSVFHVNDVHEYHHKEPLKNAGPDICDILFDTKKEVDTKIENTDHYIPNIIGSFILILLLKYIYSTSNNKIVLFNSYIISMILLFVILVISSIFIFINDIDKLYKKNIIKFINDSKKCNKKKKNKK
jgi:hypothetical protein